MERIVFDDGHLPPNVGSGPFEDSLTRQSEAKDADINVILDRFARTGSMPVDDRQALFVDVSEVGDYRNVREQINRATAYFLTLDAKVRAEFDNDAARFLDELVDPANKQKFVDLKILEADSVVPTKGTPEKAPVVPAVAAPVAGAETKAPG